MQSLEKFEQSVYIDECILTFCSFFDDHLKRFSNVFILTQDNSHIMLHLVLRTPNERTKAVGDVVKCLGEEVIPGIHKEVLLQIAKMIILILPSACGFVLSDVLVCSSSDLFTSVCCVLHC